MCVVAYNTGNRVSRMDASLLASKSFAFDEAGRTNKRDGVHIYIQGVRIAITEVAPIDDIDLLVFQTGFFFFSYFFLYLYTGNINPFLKSDSLVGKERRPKKQGGGVHAVLNCHCRQLLNSSIFVFFVSISQFLMHLSYGSSFISQFFRGEHLESGRLLISGQCRHTMDSSVRWHTDGDHWIIVDPFWSLTRARQPIPFVWSFFLFYTLLVCCPIFVLHLFRWQINDWTSFLLIWFFSSLWRKKWKINSNSI